MKDNLIVILALAHYRQGKCAGVGEQFRLLRQLFGPFYPLSPWLTLTKPFTAYSNT